MSLTGNLLAAAEMYQLEKLKRIVEDENCCAKVSEDFLQLRSEARRSSFLEGNSGHDMTGANIFPVPKHYSWARVMFRILSSHELFRKLGIWDSRHFIVTLYNHINLFISGVFWGPLSQIGGRGGSSGSRNKFWRCLWKVRAFLAAVKGVTALIIVQPGGAARAGQGRLNSVDASSQNWLKRNFRAKIYFASRQLHSTDASHLDFQIDCVHIWKWTKLGISIGECFPIILYFMINAGCNTRQQLIYPLEISPPHLIVLSLT